MVVQHNLTAMNSNRMLGLTTSAQAKSTEKLSSGYKINRAADDAAGLSISEKMRKQIRGLSQASLNAQDGISAVQTAEGALNEVQDMLQRMNELAVKSSNGTMSEDDRNYIQNEIDQLVTEIDRVSTTTKFNETYLLQGNAIGKAAATAEVAHADVADLKLTIANGTEVKAGTVILGTVGAKVTSDNGTLDVASLNGELKEVLDDSNAAVDVVKTADKDEWTLDGKKYTTAQLKEMGLNTSVDPDGATATIKIEKNLESSRAKRIADRIKFI